MASAPFRSRSKIIVEIITHIAPGRLTQSKMICIKDLVDSKLFRMPECRQILLPVFCKQIKDKLESKEEVGSPPHAYAMVAAAEKMRREYDRRVTLRN